MKPFPIHKRRIDCSCVTARRKMGNAMKATWSNCPGRLSRISPALQIPTTKKEDFTGLKERIAMHMSPEFLGLRISSFESVSLRRSRINCGRCNYVE